MRASVWASSAASHGCAASSTYARLSHSRACSIGSDLEGVMERIVTIFGGSKCGEDSEEYGQARRLGQLLAEAGFTLCTGGYLGVMEGASPGARGRGGRGVRVVVEPV